MNQRRKRTRWLLALLSLPLLACSAEKENPTAEQQAAAERAAHVIPLLQQTLVFADVALFEFDPDLDPQKTLADTRTTVRANLEQGGACAHVTISDLNGLTVDFGAGCTYTNGTSTVTVSGIVNLQITIGGEGGSPRFTRVALAFTSFVVDGFDLDGTASFTTTGGSELTVVLALLHQGTMIDASLDVLGAIGSFTMGGMISLTDADQNMSSLTLAAIEVAKGDCWPRGGTITGTILGPFALVLETNTATTGQAKLTLDTYAQCQELLSYGNCVVTPCPKEGL